MLTGFEDFNLFVYHSARGLFYDLVIWCLGPLADDSRKYGLFRCYLAAATRRICLTWIERADSTPSVPHPLRSDRPD